MTSMTTHPEAQPAEEGPPHLRRAASQVNWGDRIFKIITAGFAVLIIVTVVAIALQMLVSSKLSLRAFGFRFLTSTDWNPVLGSFGALPFIYGTVMSSLLALSLAVPISVAVAMYLNEMAPLRLRGPLAFSVELLAAVPSVVYGLWGIFALAPLMREHIEPALRAVLGFLPFFQGPNQGFGLLTGSVVLAIMITPTITSVTREVFKAIPRTYREAALALGATRWESSRTGVLPIALPGLVGAAILGLGRALGETMAVTMLIGNRPEISLSFFAPSYTMASVIANEFTEATEDLYLAALAEIGLLLFVVTILLNLVARFLVWRVARTGGSR